ncbi:Rieske 2Fe-2S domain-containing protein [Asticcacaulis sp. ZE23SCel15]|uniref:Rieske 2Fe-2S domain-containing protein n=1 Tax=Asticcacaulis sp. ZE23SCel15 TaxID=3059027 RepID=UPI00265F04F8|nr:Rieske 2Fe-2S domain-containing protein [Asticcacaulis sp. ZE23SCel15]WKL57605.1 Rieske 2Fe-2S domain-containing protein [Asticcacaulis sp. ZE23SCel15]
MTPVTPSSWIAVCAARDLKSTPRRFVIAGQAVVVFRSGQDIVAFADICPHRLAPLSEGRVIDGGIECPYHGWQFDGTGLCRMIPGEVGPVPRVRLMPLSVCEHDDLIFVSLTPTEATPYSGRLMGAGNVSALVESRVQSTLIDVAENILDASHTHFTHKGLLRGLSARRHRVRVDITGGPGWVEARYEGEPRQEGLISRLLEGGRGISIGRFMAPGIAEIEFWGPQRVNLVTTFHLRQAEDGQVAGLGILSGPTEYGLGYVKAAIFKPLFAVALAQDRHILQAASANRTMFGDPKPVIGPLDILRSSIEAILKGELPPVAQQPVHMIMEL